MPLQSAGCVELQVGFMQKGQRSDLKLMKGFLDGCVSLLVHSDGAFIQQSYPFSVIQSCFRSPYG